MPSRISDDRLADVILQSVENGAYPEDEEAVAAELPSSALVNLSNLLEQARADVKSSIRELSKITAPDIDGWISQAKQLRGDIEGSQRESRQITARVHEFTQLQTRVRDAGAKVNLLNDEVIFNEALAGTLQQVHEIHYTLDCVQSATLDYRLVDAVTLLKEAELQVKSLKACTNTRLAGLLKGKIEDLRTAVEHILGECWEAIVQVDVASSTMSIRRETNRKPTVDAETVVRALQQMELLQAKISSLQKDFNNLVLTPLISIHADGTVGSLVIDGNSLKISGRSSDTSTRTLLFDVNRVIEYLNTNLLPSVAMPLSEVLMPNLISKLKLGPLLASIPSDLDGIPQFKETLDLVSNFADTLDTYKWHGRTSLLEWSDRAPWIWLKKRLETSLHTVRRLILRGLGEPRTVERAETQIISRKEDMFVAHTGNDDWDAKWSDDDIEEKLQSQSIKTNGSQGEGIEEDVSAWGLEDDSMDQKEDSSQGHTDLAEDESDAWGWGDDDDNGRSIVHPDPAPHQASRLKPNGHGTSQVPIEREITLREKYNITALPEQLLNIILEIFTDAETLAQPSSVDNPVAPAASALLELPGLILSMFRATAPNSYGRSINGSMFLYNDCLYIVEQLRKFMQDRGSLASARHPQNAGKLDLEPDILALELFGKRAYGKEMESQRTILGDLFDGAQGFTNCADHPFAQECDIAISSTVDRLREVHGQWKTVLSHSALLQSLGSLLSTIINKIIVDVEDMNDISEPESQRLTSFCHRIALLEDLFLPEDASQAATTEEALIPLTAVYTPSWLKFQYLSNILESSLVDIKYLWTEGELSLDFGAEEVIDLIEALFADSEHRRKAIGDIRRGSRGR